MGKFLERHFSLVFFLPVAVLSVLLIIYPMLYGIYVSFFDTNLVNKWNFVGTKNYQALISNAAFRNSLSVNFKFILIVVAGHFVIGTILATILNKKYTRPCVFSLYPDAAVANSGSCICCIV